MTAAAVAASSDMHGSAVNVAAETAATVGVPAATVGVPAAVVGVPAAVVGAAALAGQNIPSCVCVCCACVACEF